MYDVIFLSLSLLIYFEDLSVYELYMFYNHLQMSRINLRTSILPYRSSMSIPLADVRVERCSRVTDNEILVRRSVRQNPRAILSRENIIPSFFLVLGTR